MDFEVRKRTRDITANVVVIRLDSERRRMFAKNIYSSFIVFVISHVTRRVTSQQEKSFHRLGSALYQKADNIRFGFGRKVVQKVLERPRRVNEEEKLRNIRRKQITKRLGTKIVVRDIRKTRNRIKIAKLGAPSPDSATPPVICRNCYLSPPNSRRRVLAW